MSNQELGQKGVEVPNQAEGTESLGSKRVMEKIKAVQDGTGSSVSIWSKKPGKKPGKRIMGLADTNNANLRSAGSRSYLGLRGPEQVRIDNNDVSDSPLQQ